MTCRGGPWKVPWYAVEGVVAGGATACHGMPRHAAKKDTAVPAFGLSRDELMGVG